MKWLNHTLIACSICAVISPPHVPFCIAGATAPDWLEFVLEPIRPHIKHRGPTHVFTHWLMFALAFTFLSDYQRLGMVFA